MKNKSRIKNCVSIEERPAEVELRNRLEDFEVDTVLSCKGSKSCLAVITYRVTRRYLIQKIPSKSAQDMAKAVIDRLAGYDVKTITFDNGTENALHEQISKALGCKCYFCYPYGLL